MAQPNHWLWCRNWYITKQWALRYFLSQLFLWRVGKYQLPVTCVCIKIIQDVWLRIFKILIILTLLGLSGCFLCWDCLGSHMWLLSSRCLAEAGWSKKASLKCLLIEATCHLATLSTWSHCFECKCRISRSL
jgi:hypothetical protein